MPSEHAKHGLGGSSAARTIACPGWRQLADELPEEYRNRTSVYAEEGTRLHEEMEKIIIDYT